jgi:hypothetical protein
VQRLAFFRLLCLDPPPLCLIIRIIGIDFISISVIGIIVIEVIVVVVVRVVSSSYASFPVPWSPPNPLPVPVPALGPSDVITIVTIIILYPTLAGILLDLLAPLADSTGSSALMRGLVLIILDISIITVIITVIT